MRLLSQLKKEELNGKIVLLRAGLNLPLTDSGEVIDNFRMMQVLPTIKYIAENCKKLIIITHIGRARDKSLHPVIKELQPHIDMFDNIEILENLRRDPRETSDSELDRDTYAHELIKQTCADIFVQDAFSVCHRKHSSIVNIPKLLPSYAGLLIEREVAQLNNALNPQHPAVFVLGGAKFATKEPLIRKFLTLYDRIFIGGAIANEFFKARGYEVGNSLIHDGKIPHDILYNSRIILPDTVRTSDSDGHTVYVNPQDVMPNMSIVDVVPSNIISTDGVQNKFVLWNGPLGYYEGGFSAGTDRLLQLLKGLKDDCNATLVTGGGDTLATVDPDMRDIFTHISAGGGAMLTYLQDGTLIGLKALE